MFTTERKDDKDLRDGKDELDPLERHSFSQNILNRKSSRVNRCSDFDT